MSNKLVYLASPYTHSNLKIMKKRFVQVCKLAAFLTKKGVNTLCPIASSHPIAKYGKIESTQWEYWRELDLNYLSRCDEMYVSMLDDEWFKSVGMHAEFLYARDNDIPIKLITKRGRILRTSINEIQEMFENKREVLYV